MCALVLTVPLEVEYLTYIHTGEMVARILLRRKDEERCLLLVKYQADRNHYFFPPPVSSY